MFPNMEVPTRAPLDCVMWSSICGTNPLHLPHFEAVRGCLHSASRHLDFRIHCIQRAWPKRCNYSDTRTYIRRRPRVTIICPCFTY